MREVVVYKTEYLKASEVAGTQRLDKLTVGRGKPKT